jgi:hypothetical protein
MIPTGWWTLCTVLTVLSMLAAGDRRWYGWAGAATVQALWCGFALVTGTWELLIPVLPFLAVYTFNALLWWKEDRCGDLSRR